MKGLIMAEIYKTPICSELIWRRKNNNPVSVDLNLEYCNGCWNMRYSRAINPNIKDGELLNP
jgi:hypothetical protein